MKQLWRSRIVISVVVIAAVGAACSKAPTASTAPSPTKKVNFLACQVTDTGGIDDRSFNATAWKGVLDAEKNLGVQGKYLESTTQNDYAPNINAFLQQNCGIIVTVGFLLGDATKAAATANPSQKFAIVDYAYDPTIPNVFGLTFGTDQAAFLAGYLAAGMTKTGKVGTFGGQKISPVTIYEDGFAAGIDYYNQQKGTNVQLLGWDPAKQNGLFTGDFENQDNGRRVTETLLQQGADIILPVAGPVGLGAAAAVQQANQSGATDSMVWVDVDGCVSAPQYCSLFITSIEKNMDVAVEAATKSALDGSFKGGIYSGTLQNGGVGIAPFHDFESKVPADLKAELNTIKQGIESGSISVDPKDYQS
jgi:basic membrane protein A and related proteins